MKAQTTPTWMLVVLILAVVALVIGMYILFSLGEAEYVNVEDKLCRQSNLLRSTTEFAGSGIRPGDIIPKSPKICNTQYETIDASDYKSCNMKASDVRTLEGLRECASHQIAQLVYRCWWMGGEGLLDQPGSWKCFTGKIVINQFGGANSQQEVREDLSKQLKEKFDCGGREKQLIEGGYEKCQSIARDIAEKLVHKLYYNGVVDYYQDIATEDKPYTQEIGSAQNNITELNEDISGIIESNLKEGFKGEDITIDVCREYKTGCEPAAGLDYDKECCTEGGLEQQSILENTFEAALTIGGTLPDIGSITEKDIKKILNEDETFSAKFFNVNKRFKFLDKEFEINPNSLFEIGFCDPPIELGSGILTRMECSMLTGQQVQLDKGGKVGISREGSPYCNVFSALNKLPLVGDVQRYCRLTSD